MTISEKEEKCLAIANQFLKDGAKSLKIGESGYLDVAHITLSGALLGQIAADKFRSCATNGATTNQERQQERKTLRE